MSEPLSIPSDLVREFRQFQRDFDAVAAVWVAQRVESQESIAATRDGLRRYLADPADPDGFGVGRMDRLRSLFAFWRGLADEMEVQERGVVPQLSLDVETRIADRKWLEGRR